MTSPTPLSRSRRRRLLAGAVVAALTLAGAAVWYARRPVPPEPPAVDLSRADPDVAAAIRTATETVTRNTNDAAAWGRLGMVLRAHDFPAASVQALQEAERLDPADARWPYLQGLTLLLSRPDDGLACLERAADRTTRPEVALRLAEALLDRGQTAEAEARARAVGPADPRAALVLARAAAAHGDWASAATLTDPILDDPRCLKQVALLRGQALARTGQDREAEGELRRAAELPEDPGWEDPFVREVEKLERGRGADLTEAERLIAAGDARAAVPLVEQAVRRNPGAPDAQLLLGRARILAGDPAGARPVLTELTRGHPDIVAGWFNLGVAEFQLGNMSGAAAAFATVVRLKPDHALGHFNLAQARERLGDRAGAVAALEDALRCRPDHDPSRQMLQRLRGQQDSGGQKR